MSLIHPDYYNLGDPTNPVQTLDMTASPVSTAAIELFRAKTERGFFPRAIAFFYTMSGLAISGTGAATADAQIGPSVGVLPASSSSGKLWFSPAASSSGGPFHSNPIWTVSSATGINLHGNSTSPWALASFMFGFPSAGGGSTFSELQPIQYPIAWLDLIFTDFTAGTMTWWATLIK